MSVRKWWNWQTHHLEGVAPKGVGVQIPPSAPTFQSLRGGPTVRYSLLNALLPSLPLGLIKQFAHQT
jgi:hypothetical protein